MFEPDTLTGAESIYVVEVDPSRRYLVIVRAADDEAVEESRAAVRAAMAHLGVPAAHLAMVAISGPSIVFTQEVKEEPARRYR